MDKVLHVYFDDVFKAKHVVEMETRKTCLCDVRGSKKAKRNMWGQSKSQEWWFNVKVFLNNRLSLEMLTPCFTQAPEKYKIEIFGPLVRRGMSTRHTILNNLNIPNDFEIYEKRFMDSTTFSIYNLDINEYVRGTTEAMFSKRSNQSTKHG